jgi:filamentous hemagglutinin family protein
VGNKMTSRISAHSLHTALLSPLLLLVSLNVAANPSGEQVVAGSATITGGPPGTVTVQAGPQGFSIGAGQTANFLQSSSPSVALNRVVGANLSTIIGSLQSNGRVFLINPNGVLISAGASLNTTAFVPSSITVSSGGMANFVAGNGANLTVAGAAPAEQAIGATSTVAFASTGGTAPPITRSTANVHASTPRAAAATFTLQKREPIF